MPLRLGIGASGLLLAVATALWAVSPFGGTCSGDPVRVCLARRGHDRGRARCGPRRPLDLSSAWSDGTSGVRDMPR